MSVRASDYAIAFAVVFALSIAAVAKPSPARARTVAVVAGAEFAAAATSAFLAYRESKKKLPVKLEIGMRITGEKYLEIDVGHRTTFVAGITDTLEMINLYSRPELKPKFAQALSRAKNLTTGELREVFDHYLGEDESRLQYQAANSFLNMLVERK